MDTYWNIISSKHQKILGELAKKSGVSIECALRNIVNYIESTNDNSACPKYFRELITARDIEGMIDLITC